MISSRCLPIRNVRPITPGVAGEAPGPIVVTDDGHRMSTGRDIVGWREQAAKFRFQSEGRKHVAGHVPPMQALEPGFCETDLLPVVDTSDDECLRTI